MRLAPLGVEMLPLSIKHQMNVGFAGMEVFLTFKEGDEVPEDTYKGVLDLVDAYGPPEVARRRGIPHSGKMLWMYKSKTGSMRRNIGLTPSPGISPRQLVDAILSNMAACYMANTFDFNTDNSDDLFPKKVADKGTSEELVIDVVEEQMADLKIEMVKKEFSYTDKLARLNKDGIFGDAGNTLKGNAISWRYRASLSTFVKLPSGKVKRVTAREYGPSVETALNDAEAVLRAKVEALLIRVADGKEE